MQFLSIVDIICLSYNSIQNSTQARLAFVIIEYICVIWFTLELIIRFIICPFKLKFIKSVLNIINLMSIIPFYIHLGLASNNLLWVLDNFSRGLRVISILNFFSYFDNLKTIGNTLVKSKTEIVVYCCHLLAGSLVFASLLWLCEFDRGSSSFTDIPASMWWAVI